MCAVVLAAALFVGCGDSKTPPAATAPAQRDAFDAVLIDEARAHGAQFVDLRPLYRRQADEGQWVEDGIHPTAAAYQAWSTELANAVPAPCK